ncbi:hypothetical protein ACFY36_11960 [Actinoplanes sp. NPDC000266]
MTTHITGDPAIPGPEDRVAPWPDDIGEWTPGPSEPRTSEPGQPPF